MKRSGSGGGGDELAALAALSGAVAVAAAAFGAHAVVGKAAEWLRTGGQYQLAHAAAALVALGLPRGRFAAALFVGGGALFAFSLYAMALGGPHWLGAVTPIGGALLIGGWLVLAAGLMRQ